MFVFLFKIVQVHSKDGPGLVFGEFFFSSFSFAIFDRVVFQGCQEPFGEIVQLSVWIKVPGIGWSYNIGHGVSSVQIFISCHVCTFFVSCFLRWESVLFPGRFFISYMAPAPLCDYGF